MTVQSRHVLVTPLAWTELMAFNVCVLLVLLDKSVKNALASALGAKKQTFTLTHEIFNSCNIKLH